jgi:type II secretory pathway component GspD/PulD (secretin)
VSAKALVFEFQDAQNDGSSFQLAMNVLGGKLSAGIGGAVNPAATFLRFKNGTIDAVLAAVAGDSRFKLLSAPSIRVRDGSKGRIVVGSDVPVLAEAQLDKNGNPVQSIQYRPSGVIFEIAPRIMRNRIELNLLQQLSNFQQTGTSNINSPTLTKREVSTVVGVESGDMIILGGLDESKDTTTRSGLSFLPRALDTVRTESSKSQVLVVLQVSKIGPAL